MYITIISDNAVMRPSPYGRPQASAKLHSGEQYEVLAEYEGFLVAGSNIWFEIERNGILGYVHISYTDLSGQPYTPSGINLSPINDWNNLDFELTRNARKWRTSKIFKDALPKESVLLYIETSDNVLHCDLDIAMSSIDQRANIYMHCIMSQDYDFFDYGEPSFIHTYNMAFPLKQSPKFEIWQNKVDDMSIYGEELSPSYAFEQFGFFGKHITKTPYLLMPNSRYVIQIENVSGWTSDISAYLSTFESTMTRSLSNLVQIDLLPPPISS